MELTVEQLIKELQTVKDQTIPVILFTQGRARFTISRIHKGACTQTELSPGTAVNYIKNICAIELQESK